MDNAIDFNIKVHGIINIEGIEIWITETMRNTWIIMGILIALAVFARIKLKSFKEVPKGAQNIIEAVIEFFDNFVKNTVGERLSFLGSWFFAVMAFILLSNLSGLFFLRSPSADWSVTFALALTTFVLIQVMGVKFRKGGYIKSMFQPVFLFFPLNLIGEIARPISLSFRLFGNVLSGMILLNLFYALVPIYVKFLVPSLLHFYFDLFAGILQAYVFCVLSLSFISVATQE